jgi:hypothetical protein
MMGYFILKSSVILFCIFLVLNLTGFENLSG